MFNVTIPWDEAIAQQMGTDAAELKTNLPHDPNLKTVATSTCSMVRDYALKELIKVNNKAGLSLKDICQGTGQIMFDSKMVKTGACRQQKINHNNAETQLNVGDGSNNIEAKCLNIEGDIFIKKHNFVPRNKIGQQSKTNENRIFDQNMLGNLNTTGLGAKDIPKPSAFLQNKQNSSQEEYPNYFNPDLNGKGFTHNSSPIKSYEKNLNQSLFHKNGYNKKNKAVEEAENGEESVADESKAILGDIGSDETIKDSDPVRIVVKVEVPDWICSTICAGLDVDGINDGSAIEDPDEIIEPVVKSEANFDNPLFHSEEGNHLYTNRHPQDKTIMSVDHSNNMADVQNDPFRNVNGSQICGQSAPDIDVCLEKGAEISHWISERILNPTSFCDYENGSCLSLMDEGGE